MENMRTFSAKFEFTQVNPCRERHLEKCDNIGQGQIDPSESLLSATSRERFSVLNQDWIHQSESLTIYKKYDNICDQGRIHPSASLLRTIFGKHDKVLCHCRIHQVNHFQEQNMEGVLVFSAKFEFTQLIPSDNNIWKMWRRSRPRLKSL